MCMRKCRQNDCLSNLAILYGLCILDSSFFFSLIFFFQSIMVPNNEIMVEVYNLDPAGSSEMVKVCIGFVPRIKVNENLF